MKKLSKVLAASLLVVCASQLDAATVTGMIQATRDASRTINGAFVITEKKDAAGKKIALALVMDENGKAIAQQYENKTVKIEGNVSGRNLTADTWKEVKEDFGGGSSSSYNDSYSSRDDSSYDDEEDEESNKKSKKSKSSKKKSDDDEEESENEESEESENEESEDSENEESEDSEKEESENEESEESEESESSEDSEDE